MRCLLTLICFILAFQGYSQKPTAKYLAHLGAAKSHKIEVITSKKELKNLTSKGKLTKVPNRGYGYRVTDLTHSHSYLVPKAKNTLANIARDFVRESGNNFFVVTSLTRTAEDQNRLRKSNINASVNESAHSFGAAFDISYVRFNHSFKEDLKLENKLENVLKLYEKKGLIYYVKEKKIKCFHVVVR